MSWLAAALIGVAVFLLAAAVLIASRTDPLTIAGNLPLTTSKEFPSFSMFLAAGAASAAFFVALAALNAAAVMRVLARDRRIPGPLSPELRAVRSLLLAPLGRSTIRLAEESELPPSRLAPSEDVRHAPLRLTVLVPAHDEEQTIAATLQSLWEQSRPPDRVVVVADNCTDATAEVALEHGADVFTTVGNTDKKAGALNQALSEVFRDIELGDVAMVMDADSIIVPGFLETAMARLEADPDLMAVGGVFSGEGGSGLVGQLQRNEYTRYRRDISRRKGRVFVLTGTASLFRTYALKAVADARGRLIPGDHGQAYDTLALTEDNEMTLALRSLGAELVSPMQCRVFTEVMPTWRALWRQRMRWQRGALENIGAYGLTRATLRYWLQQMAIGYGTIALNSYLLLLTITVLAADSFQLAWFWFAIGLVFVVERVVTVWAVGWRGRVLALPLLAEIGYDLVLQLVFVKSLVDMATGRAAGWNYVPRAPAVRRPVRQ